MNPVDTKDGHPAEVNDALPLGFSVARRWTPPGPRVRSRPAPLGSVAVAAVRFTAGLGRAPRVRRQLAGPAPIRRAGVSANVAPPRWWVPSGSASTSAWGAATVPKTAAADGGADGRLLRRAAGAVPTLDSHRPGAAGVAMSGRTIPVRRIPEVSFSGTMKGAASKLVAPRSGSPGPAGPTSGSAASKATGPPGPTAGGGGSYRSAAGAVPPSGSRHRTAAARGQVSGRQSPAPAMASARSMAVARARPATASAQSMVVARATRASPAARSWSASTGSASTGSASIRSSSAGSSSAGPSSTRSSSTRQFSAVSSASSAVSSAASAVSLPAASGLSSSAATAAAARPAVRSRWAGVGPNPHPASGAAPGGSSQGSALARSLPPAAGSAAPSSGRALPTGTSGDASVILRAWARPAPVRTAAAASAAALSNATTPAAAPSAAPLAPVPQSSTTWVRRSAVEASGVAPRIGPSAASAATGADGGSVAIARDDTGSPRGVPGNPPSPNEGALAGAGHEAETGQEERRKVARGRGANPTAPIRRLPLGLDLDHRGLARAIDALPGPGTKDPAPRRVLNRRSNLRGSSAAPQAIRARGAAHLPVAPGVGPAGSGVSGAVPGGVRALPGAPTATAATAATTTAATTTAATTTAAKMATGQAAAVHRQVGEATPSAPLPVSSRTLDRPARDRRDSAPPAATSGSVDAAPSSTLRPITSGVPDADTPTNPPTTRTPNGTAMVSAGPGGQHSAAFPAAEGADARNVSSNGGTIRREPPAPTLPRAAASEADPSGAAAAGAAGPPVDAPDPPPGVARAAAEAGTAVAGANAARATTTDAGARAADRGVMPVRGSVMPKMRTAPHFSGSDLPIAASSIFRVSSPQDITPMRPTSSAAVGWRGPVVLRAMTSTAREKVRNSQHAATTPSAVGLPAPSVTRTSPSIGQLSSAGEQVSRLTSAWSTPSAGTALASGGASGKPLLLSGGRPAAPHLRPGQVAGAIRRSPATAMVHSGSSASVAPHGAPRTAVSAPGSSPSLLRLSGPASSATIVTPASVGISDTSSGATVRRAPAALVRQRYSLGPSASTTSRATAARSVAADASPARWPAAGPSAAQPLRSRCASVGFTPAGQRRAGPTGVAGSGLSLMDRQPGPSMPVSGYSLPTSGISSGPMARRSGPLPIRRTLHAALPAAVRDQLAGTAPGGRGAEQAHAVGVATHASSPTNSAVRRSTPSSATPTAATPTGATPTGATPSGATPSSTATTGATRSDAARTGVAAMAVATPGQAFVAPSPTGVPPANTGAPDGDSRRDTATGTTIGHPPRGAAAAWNPHIRRTHGDILRPTGSTTSPMERDHSRTTEAAGARPSSALHLRQVIAPSTTVTPATTALIHRYPAAPPAGTPRGLSGPPVPSAANHRRPYGHGDRSGASTDSASLSGTSFRDALRGTITPAGLAALGATATGTSHAPHTVARSGNGALQPGSARSDTTIRRATDVPSVSSLFEQTRAWFSGAENDGSDDDDSGNGRQTAASVGAPNGARVDPQQDPGSQMQPHVSDLAERQRSLSRLLRSRSPMTEINDRTSPTPISEALSPREWDQLVDLVVERIEDKVRDELARRGRRFSPGVF